jgi:TrmH family RNA methyltransferase
MHPGVPGPAPAVYPVTERVAGKISTLETPPDVMAVFPLLATRPLSLLHGADALIVYTDGVQDPGNMGTLLRAAAAFGAAAVVAGSGSADLYGPKTVRASMGAMFAVPLVAETRLGDLVAALGAPVVYGLAAHEGESLRGVELRRPAVLVVGSERQGISAEARRFVTRYVTIPLAPAWSGLVESLNAGVAGAIALYEFSRRECTASDRPTGHAPAPYDRTGPVPEKG